MIRAGARPYGGAVLLLWMSLLAGATPPEPPLETAESLELPVEPARPLPGGRADLSDFLSRDVDLKVSLAFNGVEPAPWTLITSLAGWNTVELAGEVAVLTSDDTTLSLGLDFYVSRPVLLGLLSDSLFDSTAFNRALRWRAVDRGVLTRTALHVNSFSSVDTYGAFLLGPTYYTFEAEVREGPHAGSLARNDSIGLRVGAAGGLLAVSRSQFLGGIEMRYLINVRFRGVRKLQVGEGADAEVYDLGWRHTGPSGFAWVFYVGRRFY